MSGKRSRTGKFTANDKRLAGHSNVYFNTPEIIVKKTSQLTQYLVFVAFDFLLMKIYAY